MEILFPELQQVAGTLLALAVALDKPSRLNMTASNLRQSSGATPRTYHG